MLMLLPKYSCCENYGWFSMIGAWPNWENVCHFLCHVSFLDAIKKNILVEKRSLGYISRFGILTFRSVLCEYVPLCLHTHIHTPFPAIVCRRCLEEPCDDITMGVRTINRHRWTSDRTEPCACMHESHWNS